MRLDNGTKMLIKRYLSFFFWAVVSVCFLGVGVWQLVWMPPNKTVTMPWLGNYQTQVEVSKSLSEIKVDGTSQVPFGEVAEKNMLLLKYFDNDSGFASFRMIGWSSEPVVTAEKTVYPWGNRGNFFRNWFYDFEHEQQESGLVFKPYLSAWWFAIWALSTALFLLIATLLGYSKYSNMSSLKKKIMKMDFFREDEIFQESYLRELWERGFFEKTTLCRIDFVSPIALKAVGMRRKNQEGYFRAQDLSFEDQKKGETDSGITVYRCRSFT